MKRFLKLSVIFGLMIGLCSGLYSNGFNLNSNGSKAVAMGGAFIGLADDSSAVFWNPAGLTQMKQTTLAFFLTDIIPDVGYQFSIPGLFDIDTTAVANHYVSGSFGFFKPLSEKVVFGIYAYIPTGLGVTWEGSELLPLTEGVRYKWRTYVGIITISPTLAFKLSEKFSLGAAININNGFSELSRPLVGQYDEKLDAFALGATVGMLFKPCKKFSFGLTFRTPLKIKLKGEVTMEAAPLIGLPRTDDAEREANFPMWLGAGIAFKPSEKLTLTADVQYTNWKQMDTIPIVYSNPLWQGFEEQYNQDLVLDWKDAIQLRFGMEYKATEKLALRAGYYYDPSPGPKHTQTILLPEHTFNFITFGIGFYKENMTIDLGVEYAFGKDVEVGLADLGPDDPGMPGTHTMNIIVPNIALTFRF
ncbi:MAG: outer membrane protein transport protein [Candidatus Aminicenantes bacterium]|nr:MAG: outer membrane protein transport protein [Candidatus Aminicenantes bacterium]